MRGIEAIFKNTDKRRTKPFFVSAQVAAAAAMAFMHGAQDGQKFMAVFMLGIFLACGQGNVTSFTIPLWLMLLCSILMALGTSIGGYRIIKTVGMDMVKLETYQGFAADFTGAFSLLISSLLGLPSAQPTPKNSYYGGWCCQKAVLRQLWYWKKCLQPDLTFPVVVSIGYLMAHLFIKIF